MANQNSSCFGFLHFTSSTFKKLSTEAVTSASFAPDSGYLISESSELFQLLLPSLEKVHLSQHVQQVSCNSTAVAFVTASGFLFILGEDDQKWGTLAIKNMFSLKIPTRVQINTRISSVSLGQKHGAVLTDKGELYTWGTGHTGELGSCIRGDRALPTVVHTAKIFMIKQVLCSGNLTGFVTAGGFVYFYGELPGCSSGVTVSRQPYTIKGMTEHFIVKIEMNKDFLVMLGDKKQVFVSDACMKVSKLPYLFSKVACSDDSIVGIGNDDGLIHDFSIKDYTNCKANELVESAYFVNEVFSHKFTLFSGYFVSCAFISYRHPIDNVNLQTLSLEKVLLEDSSFKCDFPDITYKKIIGRMIYILSNKMANLLKIAVIDLKVFAKFREMIAEKSLHSLVTAIYNKLMMKTLITKRIVFNRYLTFVDMSKKYYELRVLRRKQAIEKCLLKINLKCFSFVINSFHLHQFIKNRKNHIAEKIFSFCGQKKSETKRQGFYLIKSFVINRKVIKKKLGKLFKLLQLSLKLKFISNLIRNHVEKLKIYKVITQMISYSEAQGSRAKVIKYFQLWKQNIVYLKIAKISHKYLTNVKIKKMTDIFTVLLRSSLKSSFAKIKSYKKPGSHRFKIIFLVNSISLALSLNIVPVFQELKLYKKKNKKFQRIISKILKPRFQTLIQEINQYILSRKFVLLIKILTKKLTKNSNYEHRLIFKSFIKLASVYQPRSPNSPGSNFHESSRYLKKNRISTPCLAISTVKEKKNLTAQKYPKFITHASDLNRKSIKKNTCPSSLTKSIKLKSNTLKAAPLSPTISAIAHTDIDISFTSNLTELSPKSLAGFQETPMRQFMKWEIQLFTLALAMMNTLLKTRLKSILKSLIN